MRILRCGSFRNLGWTSLTYDSSLEWKPDQNNGYIRRQAQKSIGYIKVLKDKIQTFCRENPDDNHASSYDYCVEFSFDDIQQIIKKLSDVDSIEESNVIAENLRDSLADLIKLQYLIAGCHNLPKSIEGDRLNARKSEEE